MKENENWNLLFIFTLFIPDYFKNIDGALSIIYWILEFIRIFGSLYYITKYIKRKRISLVFKLISTFQVIIFFSTIINYSELSVYRTMINVALPSLGLICFLEYNYIKKPTKCLKEFRIVLQALVFINFVQMLFYPEGVYAMTMDSAVDTTSRDLTTYFLSFKNRLIMWFLPLMILLEINGSKFYKYVFNIIILCQLIICESVTSLFVFMSFHVISFYSKRSRMLDMWRIYLIYCISLFSLVVFQIQNYFEDFLVDMLNKNVELQGRVFIWDNALQLIEKKFLLGYGNAYNGSIIEWNGYTWYAHNLFLDVLIQGGFLALIVLLAVLFYVNIKDKSSAKYSYRWSYLSNIAIFSILIEGMFESYLNFPQFYFLICLGGLYSHPSTFYYIKDERN